MNDQDDALVAVHMSAFADGRASAFAEINALANRAIEIARRDHQKTIFPDLSSFEVWFLDGKFHIHTMSADGSNVVGNGFSSGPTFTDALKALVDNYEKDGR